MGVNGHSGEREMGMVESEEVLLVEESEVVEAERSAGLTREKLGEGPTSELARKGQRDQK